MDGAIEAVVRKDGAVARIAGIEMDAAQVEEAISALLAARAAMMPRRVAVVFPGTRISVGSDNALHVQREDDGRVLLALHHPGLGWLGAKLDRVTVGAAVMRGPAARTSRRRRACVPSPRP